MTTTTPKTVEQTAFDVAPYTDNCARIYEAAEHALIGLSPFNSYYKSGLIRSLTEWAARRFATVDVFIPGDEAMLTLTAAGWDPGHAERRLHQARKKLRGPARQGLLAAGIDLPDHYLHTWTELLDRPAYRHLRAQVGQGCRTDPGLRRPARELSRKAVRGLTGDEPDDRQIDHALDYVVAEMPFMIDSPSIFHVKSSVFVYHQPFELAHCLLDGREISSVEINPAQGFLVVRPSSGE
ncbi:tRNA-dependent cyclodipeptide synthase [Streptomyces varsoviensis]|uniref:Cyclodipeptide synthase n=1 Tax=Streptomyces varsoviensis TaxID=67373 RepID=A0ABR5J9U7_9ACTN|nr:tRNA-dependent cyclodipeptide synthase [Streptomyces varsoviensis]KOG90180.1 hypothetical protein ADK38_10165 [Streptomyces varsoviensis]